MKAKAEKRQIFIIAVICIFMILLTSCSNQEVNTNKVTASDTASVENFELSKVKTYEDVQKYKDEVITFFENKVNLSILGYEEGEDIQKGNIFMLFEITNNSKSPITGFKYLFRNSSGFEFSVSDMKTIMPGETIQHNETVETYSVEDISDAKLIETQVFFPIEGDLNPCIIYDHLLNKSRIM